MYGISSQFFTDKKICHKGKRVVGWNNHCRVLYNLAREKFLEWHTDGKIRFGQKFEEMKTSRKDFKQALNYCRKNETKIKRENIFQKFALRNKKKFWREISKINRVSVKKIVSVDDKSNLQDITQVFDDKYREILNDPRCQYGTSNSENAEVYESETTITLNHLNKAISDLNDGIGWDKIHLSHF